MRAKNSESTRSHRRGKLEGEVKFGHSFRALVVADYLNGDSDQRSVAARHGISQTSLSVWVKAYLSPNDSPMPQPFTTSPSAQQAELERLKKGVSARKAP